MEKDEEEGLEEMEEENEENARRGADISQSADDSSTEGASPSPSPPPVKRSRLRAQVQKIEDVDDPVSVHRRSVLLRIDGKYIGIRTRLF